MFNQVIDPYASENQKIDKNKSLIALWTFRIIATGINWQSKLHHKKTRFLIKKRRRNFFNDLEEMLSFIGYELNDNEDKNQKVLKQQIISLSKKHIAELSSQGESFSPVLSKNLQDLGEVLDLSAAEIKLLGFFAIAEQHVEFQEMLTNAIEISNSMKLYTVLSTMLAIDVEDVAKAFNKKSRLYQSGLLKEDCRSEMRSIEHKVDVLEELGHNLLSEHNSTQEIFAQYFYPSETAKISLSKFDYVSNLSLIIDYLNSNKASGCNILIYGEPGTGKTQIVRAIAKKLNRPLYEVSAENSNGESLESSSRINACKLAQIALSNKKSNAQSPLILFDEVEDIFPSDVMSFFFNKSSKSQSKAWVNKLLEENPVPSFWVSNDVSQIDPAYIRRFDLVFKINTPPRSIRKQIIQSFTQKIAVSDKWVDELSNQSTLVPAVLERVSKVIKLSCQNKKPAEVEKIFISLMNQTLEAQGKRTVKINKQEVRLDYSLDFVNADADIYQLVKGLKCSKQGRFCLYGLPGTGKTAFGKYLAKTLDLPIIIKKASDLLSPYVGQAEMNIAAAFAEAEQENAVLQIDEADSFLQDRSNAQRSWEVTQVNEFLTQIEDFNGVFIASTNLMDNLDKASMRRFDIKLEFKPLKKEQAWALFQQVIGLKHTKSQDSRIFEILTTLPYLTPGDFYAAKRKITFSGEDFTPDVLLKNLEIEHQFKPQVQNIQGMGFLSKLN